MHNFDLLCLPLPPTIRHSLYINGYTTIETLIHMSVEKIMNVCNCNHERAINIFKTIKMFHEIELKPKPALQLFVEEMNAHSLITMSKNFDDMLGGGFPVGKIIELAGPAGQGKTQFCFQCCLTVQLPDCLEGLEGEAVFIDTEGSFRSKRLKQMAELLRSHVRNMIFKLNISSEESSDIMKRMEVDGLLSRIYYFHCTDHQQLVALSHKLSEFMVHHPNVRLILVDSIAFHFRYDFDDIPLRNRLLLTVAQNLLRLGRQYNAVILLTNQMTTRFNTEENRGLVPALGDSWGHVPSIRILLKDGDVSHRRQALLLKHFDRPKLSAYYQITELEYWGLYEQDIEPCCWTLYTKASTCKETLEALDHTFFSKFDEMDSVYSPKDDALNTYKLSSWQKFRLITWRIIEDPTYSLISKSYAFLSVFFLTLSIVLFVIETYENFRIPKTHPVYINVYGNCTRACGIYYDTKLEHYLDPDNTEPHPVIIYIDYVTFAFFLCDFTIRVVSMRTIASFMKDLLNWIDLICLVTHAVAIAVLRLELDYNGSELRAVLTIRVIRGLRIIRVMRIFKLVKHYHAFRILLYTIRVSIRELTLMIVFLLVGGVVFGSLVHLLDRESFRNIPLGLWWALVTMTTVGYGDLVPRQEAAYFVGSVCVIFGVLTIAFTVPIVVNNFQMYYQHAMARNKRPRTYWCQKRTPRVPIFGEDDMKNVDKIIYKNSGDLNCSLRNFNEPKASSDGPEYCLHKDLHNNAPPSGCRSSVSSTVTTNLSTIGIASVNVDSKSLPSVNVTEKSYHLENYSHQLLASFEEGKLRQNDIIEKQRQRQKTETQKKLDKYSKEKKSDNF